MPPKKEPCRNFARGSCPYGNRCRYEHVVPQQSKPNPFGFGTQNVQQKPNPFGFGMQNSQPRGANDFGSKQNQPKPFENKWNRSSVTNNNNSSTASQKPANQTQAPAHKCTDPESCKREIADDFKNERPMWTLTCYGHCKNGPCDIAGDVSYDELRAAAYDEAKRGLNMQSIVERERNLVQAKLGEFESLARNPNALRSNAAPSSQNPFTGANPNGAPSSQNPFTGANPNVAPSSQNPFSVANPNVAPSSQNPFTVANPNVAPSPQNPFMGANPNATVTAQSSGPPLVSSFGQLAASVNTAPGISFSSAAPPSNLFGQTNPFSNLSSGPTSKNPFALTNSFQNLGERSGFGPSNTTFGHAGTLTSQITPATLQSPFNVSSAQQNAFSTSSSVGQPTVNIQSTNHSQRGNGDGDGSIWMKDAWSIGEIPEEAPPNGYVF